MSLLAVENVTKRYRYFDTFFKRSSDYIVALDNISFSLEKGKCLGIVGESGSGKTTLAKIIADIIKPDAGKVYFLGSDISDPKKHRDYRKNVQFVFQDPYLSLNPRLTILSAFSDILKEHTALNKKEIHTTIISQLQKVGLEAEHIHRYPHQFSGGQRQRLAIARALLLNPAIIIADEPISALDVSLAAQILNLLKTLKKEGKTIILIAHDLAVVKFICDDILVLKKGKLVEAGSNLEIFNNPKTDYTKSLINASIAKETSLKILQTPV
ncbi:MAG: ATP-binding cassette domain-containing protein [Calditerrivibrio sp.]|nr:ATP-binding cassette domain-containing protein [Calditerrivibrio sp.]